MRVILAHAAADECSRPEHQRCSVQSRLQLQAGIEVALPIVQPDGQLEVSMLGPSETFQRRKPQDC